MTERPSKGVGGSRKRLSLFVGLALLLVPAIGRTESSSLLITAEAAPVIAALAVPATRQLPVRQEAGDTFMVRCGDISFSLNYAAGEPADSLREQSGLLAPVKAAPGLSNLAFKVAVAF